ncbi:ABC transporter ATP-binding protein [bacterium]|nr:ABC transporter ATP-binding protein [bacterium]
MLSFENLVKTYREGLVERKVLNGASLRIETGAFVALLGRSGSGKSTLLNLAAGLDRVDSGRVFCDEDELTALSEYDMTMFRRRKLGFIFQFFHLFPTLTVAENLGLVLELAGRSGDVEGLLRKVGLWERRATYPDKLSGGEQQRVAVARALVHCPKLVLADEPTGNLDQENGAAVLDLLRQRDPSVTLLVATHSQEVAAAADVVVRIVDGQLVVQ